MTQLTAVFGWPEEKIEEWTQYYLPGKLLNGSTMFGHFRRLALDIDEIVDSMGDRGAQWNEEVFAHFSSIEEQLADCYPQICQSRPLLSKKQQELVLGARKLVVNWPAYSVRFALLTRLASRGDVKSGDFFRGHKKFLIRLASALPGLFEADLVLIEIYLHTKEGQQ